MDPTEAADARTGADACRQKGPCSRPCHGWQRPREYLPRATVTRARRLRTSGFARNHMNTSDLLLEFNHAILEREQSVIASQADVAARAKPCPALAHDNAAGSHVLAAPDLETAILRIAVPAVPTTGLALLVCHDKLSKKARPARRKAAGGPPSLLDRTFGRTKPHRTPGPHLIFKREHVI